MVDSSPPRDRPVFSEQTERVAAALLAALREDPEQLVSGSVREVLLDGDFDLRKVARRVLELVPEVFALEG